MTIPLPPRQRPLAASAVALAGLLLVASLGTRSPFPARAAQTAPGFQALPGDRPLASHQAIADELGQRMLLHGGERDAMGRPPLSMRQLDLSLPGGNWSDVPVHGAPPRARLEGRGLQGSRAVVDPAEHIALVVCDCRNGSTHIFDLATSTWSRAPGDRLLPLWHYLFVYDPVNDRAVLFGGDERGDFRFTDEGWAYDLSPARRGWHSLPRAPFRALYQAAAYEPESGHLVVFGGLDTRLAAVGQMWRLDVARADEPDAWRDITALVENMPPSRAGATLTFVPGTARAVLFGGYANGQDLNDVWLLDYTNPEAPRWSPLDIAGPRPGARSGHSAVWDPINRRIVIYGGVRNATDFLDDAWALYPGLRYPGTPSVTPDATGTPTAGTPTPTRLASPSATPAQAPIYLPVVYRQQEGT